MNDEISWVTSGLEYTILGYSFSEFPGAFNLKFCPVWYRVGVL